MLDKLWDFIVDSSLAFFVPLVCSYFTLTSNLFLNTSCEEAEGLEKIANVLLVPCHYLFLGKTAKRDERGEWIFSDRFAYMDGRFVSKTILCSISAIPSFAAGVAIKSLSFLNKDTRLRHQSMEAGRLSTRLESNETLYRSYGIELSKEKEWMQLEGHKRRPGDENTMASEKKCLQEIAALLDKAEIHWWVDCGTCLGAYRYGGVIPWDQDIDIAVLLPDFENVYRILNQLDPAKYIVQDWSTREHSKSYIKIFMRESGTLIDIYHYAILPDQKEISYVLSMEHSFFLPEWWKIRENRFTAPTSFDTVFPLKRTLFDGIEVNMPRDTKKYLQRYYGENLSPAKIYDPNTQNYEKDLTHPYWQRAYVH